MSGFQTQVKADLAKPSDQFGALQAKLEATKTPLEVIDLAIAALEQPAPRNIEYLAGYAQGVMATYLMMGAVTVEQYEVLNYRLREAHRAALLAC